MRLIIEGPDGAGKSTLIEQLVSSLPTAQVMPRHCNSDGPLADLRLWAENHNYMHIEPGELTIYDRHPLISEPIYGSLMRGVVDPDFADERWYQNQYMRWFCREDTWLIICLPPRVNVLANIQQSKQMVGVSTKWSELWYAYFYLFLAANRDPTVRSVRYSYLGDDLNQLLIFIRGILESESHE